MITRKSAEHQADQCFLYHASACAATVAGLILTGSRSAPWVAGVWGTAVALHGLLLYGVPETRDEILRLTALGMEDLRQSQMTELQAAEIP